MSSPDDNKTPSASSAPSPSSSSPSMPSMPQFRIPSEFRLSSAWERAAQNMGTALAVGGGAAGVASLVLFRSFTLRLAFTTFGLGFGAGDAFRKINIDFENEKNSK